MRNSRIGDIILAVLVVAITAMLVIPLPTFLIDILIVLNLSIALLLLLVGLYMPNSLALLSFPTLLLLTTLFRLSLNVASSRLILTQANAGDVIHAFGTFLIRGEVVVGIIIFTIVTIVNFIVIAKGSARVSEVSARFVLDALPGKQMTIDSDLRTGLISPEQARQKREDLRKESQLFGAMDGAMKFVQGDAIAGIFIIITNIFGGLYQGLSSGMEMSDAIQTYTVLTVGDGLVSQIPALLISICAGIVVTRVSSSDQATLSSDISTQLFSRPSTIFFAGTVLIIAGLLPKLPFLPFFAVGFSLMVTGFLVRRKAASIAVEKGEYPSLSYAPRLLAIGTEENEVSQDKISLELDAAVLFKLYRMNIQNAQSWWRELSLDFEQLCGISLPYLDVTPSSGIGLASYTVTWKGMNIGTGQLQLDQVLVDLHPRHATALGLEVHKVISHPLTGSSVFWTYQSPTLRRVADSAQIHTYDFFQYISIKIAKHFSDHPEDLIPTSYVFDQLRILEKRHPGLLSEALGKNFLTIPKLTQVIHELIRQKIPVQDFSGIIEVLAEFCSTHRITAQDETDVPLDVLVDYVRIQKRRYLMPHIVSARGTVRVFALSIDVENIFDESEIDSRGHSLAIPADTFEALRKGLEGLVQGVRDRGVFPVAVLSGAAIRSKVRLFLQTCGVPMQAISVEELEPSMRLERVATWELGIV